MNAQFSLSGRTVSVGTKAVNSLAIVGTTVAGQKVTLRWNSQVIELVFRTSPTEPNELPTGNGSPSYLTSLLPLLSTYFPLREDFTAFRINTNDELVTGVYFEARKPGAAYSITPVSLQLGAGINVGVGNPTKGADAVFRERYSAYVEVWLQPIGGTLDRDTFTRVASLPVEADSEGQASLDIGAVLHPLLEPDFPDLNNPFPARSQKSGRAYFLAYSEAWGNPLRPGRMVRDVIRYAYLGGADYKHRAYSGYPMLTNRVGQTAAGDSCLRTSAQNSARYIAPNSMQFLSFLNHRQDYSSVQVSLNVTLDDRSVVAFVDLLPATPWKDGEKLTLPVGPEQLRLATRLAPERRIVEYTLRLVGPGNIGPISAAYRYIIDYAYRPFARQFLFINSLGCPETLTSWGKGSTEWERFGQLAEQPLQPGYALEEGSFADYDISLQKQTDVVTGFRTKAELRGWLDFYSSRHRLHLQADQTGFWLSLPISINTKSIKEAKDGEVLFAHAFGYVYRYKDAYQINDETEGDELPPPGFAPTGAVTIQQANVIRTEDPSIPQAVRQLTSNTINNFLQAVTWGDHKEAGYFNQQVGDTRYLTLIENNIRVEETNNAIQQLATGQVQLQKISARAIP